MTLREALLTTPTGYVKNNKLRIELTDWVCLLGHIACGNLKLDKLVKSNKWQHDLSPDGLTFPPNRIKNILAKKYLMPRI